MRTKLVYVHSLVSEHSLRMCYFYFYFYFYPPSYFSEAAGGRGGQEVPLSPKLQFPDSENNDTCSLLFPACHEAQRRQLVGKQLPRLWNLV